MFDIELKPLKFARSSKCTMPGSAGMKIRYTTAAKAIGLSRVAQNIKRPPNLAGERLHRCTSNYRQDEGRYFAAMVPPQVQVT
ncbi:hypothetical protein SDC9_161345 [bioreactor metagenome]|uniref:Uncharacterized protein n=1 Tax=bioreactor metagenome TaxID=1076179 RepID=A0A645FL05_9ZZZZ